MAKGRILKMPNNDSSISSISPEEFNSIALSELNDIFIEEKAYYEKKYNCVIYPNQVAIIQTIIYPLNHYINIIQARGAGKSHATALAYVEQCSQIPLKIAVFAPKAAQSKRLLTRMYEIINNATQEVKDAIDFKNSSSMVISFKNTSKIWALSGNDQTFSEGEHPNCFSGETFINTQKGGIKIKKIVENKLNINVRCYNEKTGELEYKPITDWHKNKIENRKMLKIRYQHCGLKLINEIICTEDHEIFSNNEWIKAKQLNVGDKLYAKESNIKKIEILENYKEHYVYDISVKDNHNYIANDILVHNCVVVDEAHLLSSYSWSSKISPMLGSHGYYQVVKIGVAMGDGHFSAGFNDKKYINLVCKWDEAERLKESGIFRYIDKKGITHEYSKYVVEALMPPSAKRKYFPDRPDLITGPGEVTELDWLMQYEIQWLDSISLFLTESQQTQLAQGQHMCQTTPLPNGIYLFGLDTASGRPNLETLRLDWTALSIWQVVGDKMLKVYCRRWQGDPLIQYDEILGELKRWKVRYGLIDFSSLAYTFVSMFQRDGVKCEGIQYIATCPESHKKWKTTIFDNFLAELNLGKIYYPKMDAKDYAEFGSDVRMMNNLVEMQDGHYEWCILQRVQSKKSTTVKIGAPSGENDDMANSDALCAFSRQRAGKFIQMGGMSFIPGFSSKTTFFAGG